MVPVKATGDMPETNALSQKLTTLALTAGSAAGARLSGPSPSALAVADALYACVAAGALAMVEESAKDLYSRRIAGCVMAWGHVRPLLTGHARLAEIDAWVLGLARVLPAIFGRGGSAPGVRNYNNNLQTTAADVAYTAGAACGDPDLMAWAMASQMEVLDEVDAGGLTVERRRQPPETRFKAEYYSWETLLGITDHAVKALRRGDNRLFEYVGKGGGAPALLRAARVLDHDLAIATADKLYTKATCLPQAAYNAAPYSGPPVKWGDGLSGPPDWLADWLGPLLSYYSDTRDLKRLREAYATGYAARRCINPIVGGLIPR